MDTITETPVLSEELQILIEEAEKTYWDNFDGEAYLGRCIFLSFYCSVNSCDFCFRSIVDAKKQDPEKARRSMGSILVEALLIKALNWRLEFLTGGYNMYPKEDLLRYSDVVSTLLKEKVWLNLGILPKAQLEAYKDTVSGIVASVETLEPNLHKKTCPDKPLEPYFRMLRQAEELNYKRSITIIIGLGEDKTHWPLLQECIKEYQLDKITLYALRPLQGTPYTRGPTSEELLWWIAKIRIAFPKIEIMVGTTEYRIPEIHLLLKAGANAFTKLPATKIFNTKIAEEIEDEVKKAGRRWTSTLHHENIYDLLNWDREIEQMKLTSEEKAELKKTLDSYLRQMHGRRPVPLIMN